MTAFGRIRAHWRGPLASTIGAGFLAQGLIAVSGLIIARLLGVEDRGHLALVALLPVILVQIGSLGLPLAVTYWLARLPAARYELFHVLRGPVAAQFAVLPLIHAAVLIAFLHGAPARVQLAGALSLITVPANLFQRYSLAIAQGLRLYNCFNLARLLPLVLYSGAALAALAIRVSDLATITALWVATILVSTLAGGVLLWRELAHMSPHVDVAHPVPTAGAMIRFGATSTLGSASFTDALQLDQALVAFLLVPRDLGLYVVAVALCNLPRFVGQSIGAVAYPEAAGAADAHAAKRAVMRYAGVTGVLCIVIGGVVAGTAGSLVPFLFGRQYGGAVNVVRLLMISAVLIGVRRCLGEGMRGLGCVWEGTLAEAGSWMVLLATVFFFARAWGIEGVAVAMVLSGLTGLAILASALMHHRTETGSAVQVEIPERVDKESVVLF